MKTADLTREKLVELYVDRGLTLKAVGKLYGVCEQTILNKLAKFGIPRRSPNSRSLSPQERFWQKVNIQPDGCWLYLASTVNGSGYGQFGLGRRKVLAHRYSWELANGRPPKEGYDLHHAVCECKNCVRPDHMVEIPKAEHGSLSSKSKPLKTHCVHGHEYTEANTYRYPKNQNQRACRECMRVSRRARKAA
jgi:hypothetical protein